MLYKYMFILFFLNIDPQHMDHWSYKKIKNYT